MIIKGMGQEEEYTPKMKTGKTVFGKASLHIPGMMTFAIGTRLAIVDRFFLMEVIELV